MRRRYSDRAALGRSKIAAPTKSKLPPVSGDAIMQAVLTLQLHVIQLIAVGQFVTSFFLDRPVFLECVISSHFSSMH